MEYQDFLFELGTEELPLKALQLLSKALLASVTKQVTAAGLTFSAQQVFATPRRLGLILSKLSVKQPNKIIEKRGPATQAAFKEGKPTAAMLGFARSCGVTADALETLQTDKGEWLVYRSVESGKHARELMPGIIASALDFLPIPKRMRWGADKETFVRPVHWLVMLLGSAVIKTTLLKLTSGRETWGHRVHSHGVLTIDTPDNYEYLLKTSGKVIASFATRKARIKTATEQAAKQVNGIAVIHDELLDEVTALTEWPVAVTGTFNHDFLKLPKEVITSVMEKQQKYFTVTDNNGNLLPFFICIANLESQDVSQVIAGNERVICPRLKDARFFYEADLKTSLAAKREKLKTIIFQTKLGTLFDKTERVAELATCIRLSFTKAFIHDDEQLPNLSEQAAKLGKSDLVSEMVTEFAELQGVMGRYYAQQEGLPEAVSLALEEQYLPRFSGDRLPKTVTGQTVALAEKIDTLVGMFGINKPPSGNKDPFSLRRMALGVVRIIVEQPPELNPDLLNLSQFIDKAIAQFQQQGIKFSCSDNELKDQITDFMLERLKSWSYSEHAISTTVFLAVKAVKPKSLFDFYRRMQGVQTFCNHESEATITRLVQANKRIANILSKAGDAAIPDKVDSTLLSEEAEIALYNKLDELQKLMSEKTTALSAQEYSRLSPEDYLSQLVILKDPVDYFFDQVLVNAEDQQIRLNRYALLQQFRNLFLKVADISFI